MSAKRYLVGIDVGGTFTDLIAFDAAEQRLLSAKVPSFPDAQWQGVLDALTALDIAFDDVRAFVHGTTIATNALLEQKGARTALVTTRGFRDVIEIGKGRRLTGGLFDTTWQRPPPLVPRDRRHEVDERIDAQGGTLAGPRDEEIARLAAILRAQGVEAVAVAFVNSYLNDANEEVVANGLTALLEAVPVTRSATLIPERGEFERTSTAVLNAYLTPVMVRYLDTLAAELARRGIDAPVNIMGSNGGAMTLEAAARRCAGTFLSGPVGGVGGAIHVAAGAACPDVITFDMGGTSTDVALVHNLVPRMSHDNQIGAYPLRMPQLDIHTIGAGGGSIVRVGPDGTLQIGPESAGAIPGPACYGRGGTAATLSDANLLLGRLAPERPLAGGLMLDHAAARAAFGAIGARMGVDDVIALADAALAVAVARMAGAVREVSVHRGFDPRAFTLLSFGGAGPMHAFLVAQELAMPRVIVPRYPGHLSALGQMIADVRQDLVKAWGGRLGALSLDALQKEAAALVEDGGQRLRAEGIDDARHQHTFSLDMRYLGQSFTLPIGWDLAATDFDALRAAFHARHEETFGYADPAAEVEIVNIRLVSLGRVDKPPFDFATNGTGQHLVAKRPVWFGGWRETPVHDRGAMPAGLLLHGPAVIEEEGGTTVVPPGWSVEVHESGALVCLSTGAAA